MAPPESDFETAPVQHAPESQGDFDRKNYLSKINEYVRKVETFSLKENKTEADAVRHVSLHCSLANKY